MPGHASSSSQASALAPISEGTARVEAAVKAQLSSPQFPLFCVTHATDQKHAFLFIDHDTAERRLYVRLLKETRAAVELDAACSPSADEPASTLYSAARKRTRDGSRECVQLSIRDVDRLWGIFESWAHAATTVGAHARHARLPFVSPHVPHFFASRMELGAFVADALKAAETQSQVAVQKLVTEAMHVLPRSECIVAALAFLVERLLDLDVVLSRATVHRAGTTASPSVASSGDRTSLYLEAAGTLFYCVAALWSQQRRRETALWALANAPRASFRDSASSGPSRDHHHHFYYQDVFETYAVRLLETFVEWAARRTRAVSAAAGSSAPPGTALSASAAALASLVADTTQLWCEEACFRATVVATLSDLGEQLRRLVQRPGSVAAI